MQTVMHGFVVGRTPNIFYADGSEVSRPKLLEVEKAPRAIVVRVGRETVCLVDREAGQAAVDMIQQALEVVF